MLLTAECVRGNNFTHWIVYCQVGSARIWGRTLTTQAQNTIRIPKHCPMATQFQYLSTTKPFKTSCISFRQGSFPFQSKAPVSSSWMNVTLCLCFKTSFRGNLWYGNEFDWSNVIHRFWCPNMDGYWHPLRAWLNSFSSKIKASYYLILKLHVSPWRVTCKASLSI